MGRRQRISRGMLSNWLLPTEDKQLLNMTHINTKQKSDYDNVKVKVKMLLVVDANIAGVEDVANRKEENQKGEKPEVENQKDALLAAKMGASIIMLDNFTPMKIKRTIAVLRKKKMRNKVKLEASGGISSKNITAYARTGVDMISVGSITNSVNALDLSLEVISNSSR